jgi:undecaprenyl-diphosphatase
MVSMTIFDAGILGVIEGLTEFLPVSSTGHLILASTLLHLPTTEFLKSFEISIQLGAILAVVVLYWRSFFSLSILKRLVVGFIPTGIIGLLLYKIVKTYLLGNNLVVLVALFIGGVLLILFELWHTEGEFATAEVTAISYKQSFFIGLFQSIAIIPGVSRSAATILGGLLLGVRRAAIVEFSFLLAVPTMLAATGLDLIKNASSFAGADTAALAVGFIVSFVVALGAIKYFLGYIRRHTFIPFGVYRIGISVILFLVLFVL